MFGSIGIPHGFCFLWNPGLLWLHVLSDSLIALAYFLIPIVLLRIVRDRKDIPYNGILLCFGAFIVACGITHIMEVVTLWQPVYWISGVLKAITGIISITTFFILLRLTPAIVALPGTRELQQVNRQLDSVLESSLAGVIAYDREWRIIYMNGKAKQRLVPDRDVLGMGMFQAFPDQSPETVHRLSEVMETGIPAEFESLYKPLGLYTRVTVSPWLQGGICIFFNDISEQKRLERELVLERALRDQRMEALAHMAGGVAHEISNPLGIIHARACNLAELAEEGPVAAGAAIGACDSIVKTTDRAMRVLKSLRMFAQESIQAGSQDAFQEGAPEPPRPAPVDALVAKAVELVGHRYNDHKVDLELTPPPPGLTIVCREVQIGQVLLNLLNNAFDAIHALPADRRWVKLRVDASPDHVTMDVLDGGPGIPPEQRAHLMEPFLTAKPMGSGVGVGLSLCQAVAHDHGGSLVLREEEAHTCFRLTLPRLAPRPLEATA